MNNFTFWQFVTCLGILILLVVILGILEKPLKHVAGFVFFFIVICALGRTPLQLQCLLVFLLVEAGITKGALFLYRHEGGQGESYYLSLIVSLLPIAICKYQSFIPLDLTWFLGAAFITYKSVRFIIEVNKGITNIKDSFVVKERKGLKKQMKQMQ